MQPPISSPGTPTNTVPQNIVGNLAGLGAIGVANGGVALANQTAGFGTTEATVVAPVQNFLAQAIKHWPHFDEQNWLEPFMVLAGLPFAFFFWAHMDLLTALFKTFVTAIQGCQIAKVQYHAIQSTVVASAMPPVAPQNEYGQNAHPWPAPNSPGWGMTGPTPATGHP